AADILVIAAAIPAMKAAACMATGRAGTVVMIQGTAAARGPAAISEVTVAVDTMTGPGGTPATPQAADILVIAAAIPAMKAAAGMATDRA
ncbi:MAG TPA: hypothetical protein PK200_14510, partial [Spirochaetota bacterium]|nr:hypothetical protein [Spirochaetota bacterium]